LLDNTEDSDLSKYYYQLYKNTQQCRRMYKSNRGMKNAFSIASTDLLNLNFTKNLNMKHNLFPIANKKIVDFTTGQQRDRERHDMFSFECSVSLMEGDSQNFVKVNRYMTSTFCEDQELVDYMCERLGVFLTGETLREVEIWHGIGRNGKSTTSDLLRTIMGPFFTTVNKAVFIENPRAHQSAGSAHTSHLVPLVGKRLGMSSEIKESSEFNTAMLKGISGGDPITYRPAYGKEELTFVSFAKMVLMTNPKPQFDFDDGALIDRLRYIPFKARFVDNPNPNNSNEYKADKEFIEEMNTREQLNQFFTYLVGGALRFYNRGRKLITPAVVMADKTASVQEANRVGNFINDCCDVKLELDAHVDVDEWTTSLRMLNNKFDDYLRDNGYNESKRGELSKDLSKMGFRKIKNSSIMFRGIKLAGDHVG